MSQESEELRNARWSEARLREEAYVDANSQGESGVKIEDKLLESQSTSKQLTQQIKELQEVVSSWQEAQDFKNLETASSSGSVHAAGKPSVFFLSFFSKPCCSSRDFFNTWNSKYRVAIVYGLGRTIYTLFFFEKKGAAIYGRNMVLPLKSDISHPQHALTSSFSKATTAHSPFWLSLQAHGSHQ